MGVGAEPLNSAPGAEEGSLHQYRDLTLLTLLRAAEPCMNRTCSFASGLEDIRPPIPAEVGYGFAGMTANGIGRRYLISA